MEVQDIVSQMKNSLKIPNQIQLKQAQKPAAESILDKEDLNKKGLTYLQSFMHKRITQQANTSLNRNNVSTLI
jgi:hypothetical protein